jgi:tetratricopeptide (TPR) repeat protein
MLVGIARSTAIIGDGHTSARVLRPELRAYPVLTQVQDDGVRIRRIPAARAELIGASIERVEKHPINEVVKRLSTLISADNRMGVQAWLPYYLVTHEVLAGLDLLDGRPGLTLVVTRTDGAPDTVTLPAYSLAETEKLLSGAGPEMAVAGQHAPPQLRNAQHAAYWFQWLPANDLVYARIDRLVDQPDLTFPAYVDSLFGELDRHAAARLILDLRALSGGNHIARPLIHAVIRREQLTGRGRLFVLIGRHTFSAGQHLVALLAEHASPIFVGEPTGGRPNGYGVLGRFRLPHSGLEIRYSRYFIQNSDPADYRHAQQPHLTAAPDVFAETAGRDPAIEAVLGWQSDHPPLDATVIAAAYERGGVKEAGRFIRAKHAELTPNAWQLEAAVNTFAYSLFHDGRMDGAFHLFRLNTELFPDAWNAWDSYGEVLAAQGRHAEAVRAYETSLALNGYNANARRALRHYGK